MVATTVFVAGFITETVLPPLFVTYRSPLFGLKAMPIGKSHGYGCPTTVFVAGSITETVF